MTRCCAVLTILVLGGCTSDPMALRPVQRDAAIPPSADEVTYYEHVRPILVDNCTMCHRAGGIAPFALQTYDQAFTVGARIRDAVNEDIMPPFLADASGACNTWSNHRGLTDGEIQTIDGWVDGGKLEGDSTIPAPPEVELPTLSRVDLTLEMPSTYAIDERESDDYRCFVVETGLAANTFVTGYDVHPGNAQRVHHVIVYNPATDAAGDQARSRDTGTGYPCFGAAGVPASPMVLWAPGVGATTFPEGSGLEVVAGRPLIIQVHYNNLVAGSPNDDRTTIALTTEPSVALPGHLELINNLGLVLPPNRPRAQSTSTHGLSDVAASFGVTEGRLWGVLPHMHTRGTALDLQLRRDGGEVRECVIDVPRWDFNWQLLYWLTSPIEVSANDLLEITCTYDTRGAGGTITWGESTTDEMCLAYVYLTQ